jgi:ferredoxin-NADP reductase
MVTPGESSASAVTNSTAPPVSRWQPASLAKVTRRTKRVSSFHLTLPQPFSFHAGQHVDVRLTAPDGYQAQRSYSIASAPETVDGIELAIERLDDGEVSPFFHDIAAVGDEIELRGPIGGHFIWSVADGGPLLLVAGGSGVAPLMAMIRHRAAQGSQVPTLLLYSSRTWDDVVFRDELLAFGEQRTGFDFIITQTREPARRSGDYARRIDIAMVSTVLARLAHTPKHVFVCGGNPFVEAASQALVDASVSASIIRTERFGG